jgi:putative FmdB family regulatory protein
MPTYDYICTACGKEFDRLQKIVDRKHSQCDCGGVGNLILSKRAPGISIFQPGVWRDIASEPIMINNPQELRDALDANGGQAPLLEDGTWKTSPGPDPVGVRGADPNASGTGEVNDNLA